MVTDDYQIVHVERVQCSRGGAERVPMALFTKKDLGLLLPDDAPSDPVSLRHTKSKSDDTQQFEPLKPAIDPSKKVVRYRAGQVPHFAAGYEEERGFVTASSQVRGIKNDASTKAAPASSRRRIEAKVVLAKSASSSSSRPRQLAQEDAKGGLLSGSEDGGNPLQDSSSEEDDEEFNRRRRMLRNKMKEREESTGASTPVAQSRVGHAPAPASPSPSPPRKSERRQIPAQIIKKRGDAKSAAAAPAVRHESSSSDSSGSSEWETDTDDSDNGEQLLKPVFVPKKARETLKRQEELAAEEERRVQRELEKQQARKLESRRLVAEAVRREQEGEEKEAATDGEMPDDTDGLDPEQEYRDWELREMRRIKRDRDRKEQRRKEAEETLRRRNMTEEERQAEDAKLKKNEPKEKKQLKFMQKYYHKGAFYMDDSSIRDKEDVRKRDASGATLEDKFNKEMLPQVMQVKNFGRAGRTKYTHLADQDTSTRDSLWNRNDRIREKYIHKMGGMRDLDVKRRKKE